MNINMAQLPNLSIRAEGKRIRAIVYEKNQITTGQKMLEVDIENGFAKANPKRDIAKIAVVERHKATGNVGLGFICGFGIKQGAIASSVAHDSHNLICIGVDDEDMLAAIRRTAELDGGVVIVVQGKVLASLPLPVGGLMSNAPLAVVARGMKKLLQAAAKTGCTIPDPITALSFLSLTVIPSLKLTDKGLADVDQFCHVPLFEEAEE